MRVRRVVTGHNGTGESTIKSDQFPPRAKDYIHTPGFESALVWSTSATPALPFDGEDPTPAVRTFVPGPGETRFLVVTFPPDSVFQSSAFDPVKAVQEQLEATPGLTELFEPEAPGMHTTPTVDYGIVLEGEIWLELDNGQLSKMKKHDIIIQNGTRHAWRNPSSLPATVAFVLIGAAQRGARAHGTTYAAASASSHQSSVRSIGSSGRTMLAARLYNVGEPMVLEQIPIPEPDSTEVRVRVKACNIVPNLANVLKNWGTWFPQLPLPKLPAIFGLDPSGVIDAVGSRVHNFKPGDRVYVNPGRYCGSCEPCRNGDLINCTSYAFCGYFGFSEGAKRVLDENPYGGLAEYMLAPQYSLVKLPDNLTFEAAARFGYLGTCYSAMRKAGVRAGSTILVNGISGTLGIGCALFGLGMGATRILGTARNRQLLERVKALSPRRIEVFQMDAGRSIDDWVRETTGGEGVDCYFDCLGPGATNRPMLEGMRSLRRGGKAVNIGAVAGGVPLDVHTMMDQQQEFAGSAWFTAGEGQEMAEMVRAGTVDLSVLEHVRYPLTDVNKAIAGVASRNGGFTNFVICP
jgi:threonine dehydrogenase-like Zn-dependent dehydrogenase/quercetin dioxygenase-like cupin family protein